MDERDVMDEEVRVRDIRDDELGLVFDSWIRSSDDYPRDSKRKWIERELARPDTRVLAAVFRENEGDPELVLGWAAVRGNDCVLYVYVKLPYRGNGIAKLLIGDRNEQRVQHLPRSRRIPEGWKYDRWL